jgi:hypothetical protein
MRRVETGGGQLARHRSVAHTGMICKIRAKNRVRGSPDLAAQSRLVGSPQDALVDLLPDTRPE